MADYLTLRRLFREHPDSWDEPQAEFRKAVIDALRRWEFPEGIKNWFNDFDEAFDEYGYSSIFYDRNYARMLSTVLITDEMFAKYKFPRLINQALVCHDFNRRERVREVIAEMVNVYGTNPLLIYSYERDLNMYLFSLSNPEQRMAFQSISNLIPEEILDAYPETVKHPIDYWTIERFINSYIRDGTKLMKYAPNYGLNMNRFGKSDRQFDIYSAILPLISDGARIPTFIPMHTILILLAERLPSHNSEIGRRLPDELIRKLHPFLI